MKLSWQMEDFRRALMQSDLSDLGFRGVKYTWCNRRQTPDTIWARLDRGCGNSRWWERHSGTTVMHKAVPYSDHVMLHIQWNKQGLTKPRCKNHFRFDSRWLQSEDCYKVVEAAWQATVYQDPNTRIWRKIQDCRLSLIRWNREVFKQSQWEIKMLEERYAQLERGPLDMAGHTELERVHMAIEECHAQDLPKWKQLSKIHWLRDGDSNTRYFHSHASTRRRQNTIMRLRDEEGVWKEGEEDIQGILLRYFREIFTSSGPSEAELNTVLSLMQPRVTSEMNQSLTTSFTAAEVKQAIFGMFPFKSPGPDSMPPIRTISYSLTLNGDHFGYFRPERGIRQGDPSSPYLFIFCAEAFSCLIQDAEHCGRLTGVAVARQAPKVSHLLFVDGTLMFCRATIEQIGEVWRILWVYARASGQEINLNKSSMTVSGGIPGPIRYLLGALMGVRVGHAMISI
ncbi:UNVERIFIED_CONTAM: putative mitochondrial protein [Sesamum latifolium]|uniref:Mitochondrial protein n=1 Tax=Sesamum latifolium TaxID=2727402 RepID=A0AAW2X8X2_9LAMI